MTATTTTFNNGYVMINGTDISHECDSVSLPYSAAQLDNTTFGQDTKINTPGLKTQTLTIAGKADFSASGIDSQLFALIGAAPFTVAVRPVNAAKSTSNPEYSFSATLKDYSPITGKVGDLMTFSANFEAAGTLTRATS